MVMTQRDTHCQKHKNDNLIQTILNVNGGYDIKTLIIQTSCNKLYKNKTNATKQRKKHIVKNKNIVHIVCFVATK